MSDGRDSHMNYLDGLAQVRRQMDRYVVGHNDVKEALMLGLIAREHIYLEGPPGTAKTMLAEIHQQFIDAVRKGRGKRLNESPEMFSGLMWTGARSVELGLADDFGSVQD